MAPDGNVTVNRTYLETLVRRANFNADTCNDANPSTPAPYAATDVSRAEYEDLVVIAQKYANLTRNLLRGGIQKETIASFYFSPPSSPRPSVAFFLGKLLSKDDESIQNENHPATSTETIAKGATELTPGKRSENGRTTSDVRSGTSPAYKGHALPRTRHSSSNIGGAMESVDLASVITSTFEYTATNGTGSTAISQALRDPARGNFDWANDGSHSFDQDGDYGNPSRDDGTASFGRTARGVCSRPSNMPTAPGQIMSFERNCRRSIQIQNLADGTTHSQIVSAIHGGALLEVFIRPYDHSATVSFVHSVDATAYLAHVQKHGLYIKQKRVNARWNERQFTVSNHVAHKLSAGATRNLVIRRFNSRITVQAIRDDLEHIHNLIILSVNIEGGSCYISTNSVHNALFARTCMISRQKYKGSKIEWYPDECAKPIISHGFVKSTPKRPVPVSKKAPLSKATNRFQLLNIDEVDRHSNNRDADLDDDATTEDTQVGGVFTLDFQD